MVDPQLEDHNVLGTVKFGCFAPADISESIVGNVNTFVGYNCQELVWDKLPSEVLHHILDLRQAKYLDQEIMGALDIISVPPEDYIFKCLKQCIRCLQLGYLSETCTSHICSSYNLFYRDCSCERPTRNSTRKRVSCGICKSHMHRTKVCPPHWVCSRCGFLGHLDHVCGCNGKLSFIWKQCINEPTNSQHDKGASIKKLWVPK